MTAVEAYKQTSILELALEEARHRIEVLMSELEEARRRRDVLVSALRLAFPGCRIYVNGSVAHGDALTPLTDVDLGVVVPNPDGIYGPGKVGPNQLQERAAEAIKAALKDAYPRLRVEFRGKKRAILVRFGDPVTPGQEDFTADVIVAIDNPTGAGLYIPSYMNWDRSHPEEHTRLVREAVGLSEVAYSRGVRLLKHWARSNDQPLCSWHIKALALGCLTRPMSMLEALNVWFTHAIAELEQRDTPDPAGVAPKPIGIPHDRTHRQLAAKLTEEHRQLQRAIELEADGWHILALDELARFFNDEQMLPRPDQREVTLEEGKRRAARHKSPALILQRSHKPDPRPERDKPRAWAP
jgi:predicted nucleotidyltransferase